MNEKLGVRFCNKDKSHFNESLFANNHCLKIRITNTSHKHLHLTQKSKDTTLMIHFRLLRTVRSTANKVKRLFRNSKVSIRIN